MFGEIWSVKVGRIFTLHMLDKANLIKITDFLSNFYKLPEQTNEPNTAHIVFFFSTRLDMKRDVLGVWQVMCNRTVLETKRDGNIVSGPW